MNIKISVLRKIIACILSSVILSSLLTFTGYSYVELNNFIPIIMVTSCLTLLIGLPCSIISDAVCYKIKGRILYAIVGLVLHLSFAGITTYFFIINDNTLNYNDVFIFSIFISALGIWLIDTILKNRNIFVRISKK